MGTGQLKRVSLAITASAVELRDEHGARIRSFRPSEIAGWKVRPAGTAAFSGGQEVLLYVLLKRKGMQSITLRAEKAGEIGEALQRTCRGD